MKAEHVLRLLAEGRLLQEATIGLVQGEDAAAGNLRFQLRTASPLLWALLEHEQIQPPPVPPRQVPPGPRRLAGQMAYRCDFCRLVVLVRPESMDAAEEVLELRCPKCEAGPLWKPGQ